MGIEYGGLTAEQIDTPEAILGVTDEGKPRGPAILWIGSVVLC